VRQSLSTPRGAVSWNPGRIRACPINFPSSTRRRSPTGCSSRSFPIRRPRPTSPGAPTRCAPTHQLSGRPLAPERFHITLHHLGDHAGVRRDIVAMAGEAAETMTTSPFEVAFDRAASFHNGGNNPFVLQGGEGLEALKLSSATWVWRWRGPAWASGWTRRSRRT
jgi:hypothetical protein